MQIERSTYENVYVHCPKCRRPLIFNRVSDLETVWPIDGMDVVCSHADCVANFSIHTDVINPPYDLLVTDSIQLLEEKRYSACVVQLATALESMLSLYLRVEMVYRPAAALGGGVSTNALNIALGKLHRRTRRLPYFRLRDTAIRHAFYLGPIPHFSSVVASIQTLNTESGCPKDDELRELGPPELSQFLLQLKSLEVHTLRNKVVHHQSYRPHRREAEEALKGVSELMVDVDDVLGLFLGDDLDAYISHDQGHLGRG